MSDVNDLIKWIDSLSSDESRRILAIIEYGEHICRDSLMSCCGERLCPPCFSAHLNKCHGPNALLFWNRISQTDRLTWNGKPEVKPKSKSKPRRRKPNDPIKYVPIDAHSTLEALLSALGQELKNKGLL
jgi:hypothetical protein